MKKEYFDFYFYKSLDNTNDKIKELSLSQKSKSHLALFSKEQNNGRGRKNRLWISEKGDLTCSFLIKNKLNPKDIGKINLIVVHSLINIFKKIGIKNLEFKWPNDIFIKKKKIAGVLIETNINKGQINKLIIGIGINVVSKDLSLKINCISLSDLKKKIDALSFFFLISRKFYNFSKNLKIINFNHLSMDLSKIFFNRKVPININLGNNSICGMFKKIDSSGQLILLSENKTMKLNYGEII